MGYTEVIKTDQLDVIGQPYTVMGILNLTPDSFSDGGQFLNPDAAIQRVKEMIEEGADIIDIGGESTRPGAQPLTAEEEVQRVVPVIEAVRTKYNIPMSIDTSKAEVMKAAIAAGATMINDVRALQEPGALDAAAELQVPVCLMHMQGQPRTMQQNPTYADVVNDVRSFLLARLRACVDAGIDRKNLLIDPGFGFGKTLAHNLSLLKHLPEFVSMGLPILVGISRKSMLGTILDAEVDQRVAGGLATTVLGFEAGAKVFRVHDVKQTVDALKVCQAVQCAE